MVRFETLGLKSEILCWFGCMDSVFHTNSHDHLLSQLGLCISVFLKVMAREVKIITTTSIENK